MIIIFRELEDGSSGYWKVESLTADTWASATAGQKAAYLEASQPTAEAWFTAEQVIQNGWVQYVVGQPKNVAAAPITKAVPKPKVKTRVYNKDNKREVVYEEL